MSRFAIKYPYFIIVVCLMVCVVGVSAITRLPVDLFPEIKIPVVVVATFFSGMPPEQIENDITSRFERPIWAACPRARCRPWCSSSMLPACRFASLL